MDEFDRRGFLSNATAGLIPEIRSDSAAWFALNDRLSDFIQQVAISGAPQLEGKFLTKPVLAQTLLLRSAANYQAALLLAERGMVVEARILIRSLLENAFSMAALLAQPDEFILMLKADDLAARRGQAKAILDTELTTPANPKLREFLRGADKGKLLNPNSVAAVGQIEKQYILYKMLCNDAAHPSLKSLRRYARFDPADRQVSAYVTGAAFAPEINETLRDAFLCAMPVVLAFIHATNIEVHGLDGAEINKLADDYLELFNATFKSVSEPID